MADDEATKETHVIHFEENGNFDRSWREEKWGEKTLNTEAEEVYIDEKELGPAEALKAYPKAVMWSLVLATCVIMEGYDTNLLGNFYAYRKSSTQVIIQIINGRFQPHSKSSTDVLWESRRTHHPAIS